MNPATSNAPAVIRPAEILDQQRLANLIHFEIYVHRHLDWRSPLEWIGSEPFLVAVEAGQVVAALACPAERLDVSWLRLFVSATEHPYAALWHALWLEASARLRRLGVGRALAIPMSNWLTLLLKQSGFNHVDDVVILAWQAGSQPPAVGKVPGIAIQSIENSGEEYARILDAVWQVDSLSFEPEWQYSKESFDLALKQAASATVAVSGTGIVGYQISTFSTSGGHIARLAVHPDYQGRGIGAALVQDVQCQFRLRGIGLVTVNTQQSNQTSLHLYRKLGFQFSGDTYPVYELKLS